MTNQDLITGEKFGAERDAPRTYLLAQGVKLLRPPRRTWRRRTRTCATCSKTSRTRNRASQPSSGEGEDAWGIAQICDTSAAVGPFRQARAQSGPWAMRWAPRRLSPAMTTRGRWRPESRPVEESYQVLLWAAASAVADFGEPRRRGTTRCSASSTAAPYSLFQALHTNDHARQIARLKAKPDFP